MAGARHLRRQRACCGQRLVRLGRRFHRVDVVVRCPGVFGIALQHAFERREHRGRALLGPGAADFPVVPRRQVHQRFGVQHLDIVVVREAARGVGHRVGIRLVERRAVLRRLGLVALGHGTDQRLFGCTGAAGELDRLRCRRRCRCDRFREHRRIDVGTEDQGLAPEAHRAIGIELLCGAEGARGLGMIETVGKPQPLVEVSLRLGVGGAHLHVQGAEIVVERRHARTRRARPLLARLERARLRLCEDEFFQQGRAAGENSADGAAVKERIERFWPPCIRRRERHRQRSGDTAAGQHRVQFHDRSPAVIVGLCYTDAA